MKIHRIANAVLVWFSLSTGIAHAAVVHDSNIDWRSVRGPHFIVHYPSGAEAQAQQVMAIAERVHRQLSSEFNWQPRSPTEIVISDEYDLSNGFAMPFPANRINLWLAPPDDLGTLEDHAGWLETVIQHEYTHILHLDKARGFPKVLRSIIGRAPTIFPNVFPNAFQPTWLIEGLAVYHETDRARGIGRGQSSLFDMYMRKEVEGGMKPLRQVNQEVDTWPAGIVPYLYGVQFYNYVAERYGADKVQRWVENYSGNGIPYRISSNSQRTIGRSLDNAWDDFTRDRQSHYGAQLEAIRARGEQAGERLSMDGYSASQAVALPDGTIFYTAFDGRSPAAIMVLRPGANKPQRLTDIYRYARIDAHPVAGVLLAQPERCRNARLAYDLYRVDVKDGDMTRLTQCARYRHAAWHPDGAHIVAVHSELGQSRLDLLDEKGKFQQTLWQGQDGETIADLAWSPDATQIVASVWRRDSGWNLELFSINDKRWRALTRDAAIDMQPRFARDGKSVLFSSDHGGVYNLRRLELASGKIATLTNVTGGAFYPAEGQDGVLYYVGYGSNGFDLYRVRPGNFATPTAPAAASGIVARAPDPVVTGAAEDYSPWHGLLPRWWWPHIVYDIGRREFGAATAGTDALFRHLYFVDAAYDFKVRSGVGQADYIYDRWWPVFKLHAERENDFTRGNNHEVSRVRHDDNAQVEIALPWLTFEDRFSLHAAVVTNRESDARLYQNASPQPATQDSLTGVAAVWETANVYPLSISRNYGREVRLVAENSDAFDGDYTGKIYTLDWREFIPLGGEHVLALRLAEGWGTDNPRPFKLGGSRGASEVPSVLENLGVDTPFNVRRYALRGYPEGLASLAGRRMQLASLEWRFPIQRIERGIMSPPMALHQLSGVAFVDSGVTWSQGGSPDDRRLGAGMELHADSALLYSVRFNLRLGYAHGFDDDGENQIYLRIGSSF